MDPKKITTQKQYEQLMRATNMGGAQHFSQEQDQELQVKILPDESVKPSLFVPHQFLVNTYKAHPITVRAVRREIFFAGSDEFLDLEYNYSCESCQNIIDVQFWHFCPHCEKSFPKQLPPPL